MSLSSADSGIILTMEGDRIEPIAPREARPDNPAPTDTAGRDFSLARMKLDGYFDIQP